MDITLIKTFLEVANTGSFVAASDHLFVTQSAVSLRIQRLETSLGQALFLRSKAGAELTPAGREFEHYALSIVRIWAEARQQIALPEGYSKILSIGAQYSLWPRLGFRWIDALRAALPDLSLRAEVGLPDQLTRMMTEGRVQAGLFYMPQIRPGLAVTRLADDELVMAASWPDPDLHDLGGRYAFVDWGPEFVRAHAMALPELTNPGLTFALGSMVADFMITRNFAAYVPARYIKRYLEEKRLYLVADAPRFPYPVWAVWQEDLPDDLRKVAEKTLRTVVRNVAFDSHDVIEKLSDISDMDATKVLGEGYIFP